MIRWSIKKCQYNIMYHKKLCILVISCEFYNSQMYKPRDIEKPCVNRDRWIYEKRCWEKYMNCHPDIDVYFLEYGESNIKGNTIFVPYDGFNAGIYKKTIYGMKMLEKTYEFYLRTNLNTFVIFDNILSLIDRIKCKHDMNLPFYGGKMWVRNNRVLFNRDLFYFASGMCTFMNYKAVQKLMMYGFQDKYTLSNFADDIIIGLVYKDLNIKPTPYEHMKYDWKFGKCFDYNIKMLNTNIEQCCVRTVRSHNENHNINASLIKHFYDID